LGLAICANIVGAAGGQLTAGNVRGGGASFKVSLAAVHRAGSLEGGRARAKTPRVVSQRGLRELVTPTTSVP
jgi:hypothetical protein